MKSAVEGVPQKHTKGTKSADSDSDRRGQKIQKFGGRHIWETP